VKSISPRSIFTTLLIIVASVALMACKSESIQHSQSGQCPQARYTEMAPAAIASLTNPLSASQKNIEAGEDLYMTTAKPVACVECHGEVGDGNGVMASMFEPAPRNFTCSDNVGKLTDGQFFWIIKNGSIGTSMPAFDKLSEQEIWQLTMYLRTLEMKIAPASNSENLNKQTRQTSL